MPGRRKRIRKGIESISKQIEIHKGKIENAKRSGNIGLASYYEKEIESLRLALGRKEAFLRKGK